MGRKHGRKGRILISLDGTAKPSLAGFITDWNVDKDVPTLEVTALGDDNEVNVAGLPTFSGSVSGFVDAGTGATSTDAFAKAAEDGVARGFYAYIDFDNPNDDYFFGTALFSFNLSTGVSKAVSFSSNLKAASKITQVYG